MRAAGDRTRQQRVQGDDIASRDSLRFRSSWRASNKFFAAAVVLYCGCGASDGTGTVQQGMVALPGAAGTLAHVGTGGVSATTTSNPTLPTAGRAALPPTAGVGAPPVAGTGALPMAGRGAAGTGMMAAAGTTGKAGTGAVAGTGAAGTGPTMPIVTNMDPMIPAIMGTCPSLETGSTQGVDGQVQSGPMPAEATAPMLLYWHGTGSTSGEYAFMDADVANGVISEGGIIVSFQGTTNQGDCSPSGTFIFCTGDFAVMDQYVACGVKNRNVDPHRIYTAGCSAGGLMATAMAMQRSEYIAAAAPNSGGVTFGGAFSSMHTPPLMTIHGAPGSDVVGVDFSQTSATADMLFKQHGGFAIDCNTGGGHCGGSGLAPDAWTFFKAHPFGVSPEPYMGGLPPGFSSQCTIQ